jgi:hypothetical protein
MRAWKERIDERERNIHKDCISHYRFTMNVIVALRDYTELEFECFKEEINLYIWKLVALYSKDGMSNNNRILSSGHLLSLPYLDFLVTQYVVGSTTHRPVLIFK